jgi:hypothetical protein
VILFLWGALAAACVVAALVFMRFWRLSRDRFFVFFGAAFAVFGVHWTALAAMDASSDHYSYVYVIRLVAFLLILVGILDKNRRG